MARQALRDGIEAVCATPHIRHDHDVRIGELASRRAELSAALREQGCETAILPGGEVAATAVEGLGDGELAAVSLGGGGRWILLEPGPGPLDERLEAAVAELGRRGYRSVIAHPERHLGPDLLERLAGLVAQGALVQATAAAFTTGSTREGMATLARAGLVHVLGSDSHSAAAGRPVAIAGALSKLRAIEPVAAHLDWVARAAPAAIVRGEELTTPFAPALPPPGRP